MLAGPTVDRRPARALVLALAATLPLLTVAVAQEPAEGATPAQRERELLLRRLRRLDLPYTDWSLFRDVGERVAAAGAAAQPVVAVEVEVARGNADPRYRLRLLGVQVRVDPEAAIGELAKAIGGDDEGLAALAARVLGRSGVPPERLEGLLRERMVAETRASVRSALVLAAGEAAAVGVAPLLRSMLEKGGIQGGEVPWAWTALAMLGDRELATTARTWLAPHSPLLGAGVLLARRYGDAEAERPLLRLLETEPSSPLPTWIALGLGACGGDAARKVLRTGLGLDEPTNRRAEAVRTGIDPRYLALLRLGDRDARSWAAGCIQRSATLLEVGVARLPELFGRWRVDGAAADLVGFGAQAELPLAVRVGAARGLCWLQDRRGLEAAVALLGDDGLDAAQPEVVESLLRLQRTLFEFVGDPERPDYRGLVLGDRAASADAAVEWRAWLTAHPDQVPWRSPGEDTEDLTFWF